MDPDAKQRDQRLIRQRIQAGLLDFRLLATYPDSQYDLAFDDVSDEELRMALADTYVAVERLRSLHEYDQDQLIQEAQSRAETLSTETDDVRSLEQFALRTETEMRQQTEERFGVGRWVRRARTGIVLGSLGLLGTVVSFVLLSGFAGGTSHSTSVMMAIVAAVACLLVGLSAMIIVGHELLAILTAGETLASQVREGWQAIQHRVRTVPTWLAD